MGGGRSKEQKVNAYKVINLQNLKRKQQKKPQPINQTKLLQQLSRPDPQQQQRHYNLRDPLRQSPDPSTQKLYFYRDTAPTPTRILSPLNSFFNAFYLPYNGHGDILLVPDDIWLMISLFLAKYIDRNAEELRGKFVGHQGKMNLRVVQYAYSKKEAEKKEEEWEYYFQQIIKQVQQNTVQGTVQALSCNFTTTTPIHKLVSTSIIMSSFKSYFTYERTIMGCGLNNIYFAGLRADWVKVWDKLKNLQQYDVDGELKRYVERVGVIVKKFVSTYDNDPDVKWWNQIMTTEERRVGSGIRSETFVEGWILHFYGIYRSVELDKIPRTVVSVPIKLVNMVTNRTKMLELRADWVSVSKVNQFTYKPDIGVSLTGEK